MCEDGREREGVPDAEPEMRHHFTATTMFVMEKRDKCGEKWRSWNFYTLLVGMENGADTLENSLTGLFNAKQELSYDLAILPLGIYLREFNRMSTEKWKHKCSHSITITARKWKPPECLSSGGWTNSTLHRTGHHSATKPKEAQRMFANIVPKKKPVR